MSKQATEMEFVVAMAELGAADREAYRQLRAEAWAMVAANHGRKDQRAIATWLEKAS
jgi:hypothetical protein